jgi:virulence-associated protein VagC
MIYIMGERGKQAKVFWTGRSQAVRLPKDFRLAVDTVLVRREGSNLVLVPVDDWPEGWFEMLTHSPADMKRPRQGKVKRRAKIR